MNAFFQRRQALAKKIGKGLIVVANQFNHLKSHWSDNKRYDTNFFYLTGLALPNSVLVLDAQSCETFFFTDPPDPIKEIWEGSLPSFKEIQAENSFDGVFNILEIEGQLIKMLDKKKLVFWPFESADTLEKMLKKCLRAKGFSKDHKEDLKPIIHQMRLIKDKTEISCLEKAAAISTFAYCQAIPKVRFSQYEYQIESELLYHFMQKGARSVAFDSIVASGKNACVLHYTKNNAALQAGELLLIDAGCQWQGYASDITRTVPINGYFSPPQQALYDVVLAAQEAAIRAIRPHINSCAIEAAAQEVLVQGMIDLKLLKGSVEENIDLQTYQQFYKHRIGHWLGLDVHDVGTLFKEPGTILQPNMCLTIEPGLYISNGDAIPPAFCNIGIRIEDDIRVTPTGCKVYTTCPKTPEQIQNMMHYDS